MRAEDIANWFHDGKLRKLTVREVRDLMDVYWNRERKRILDDLDLSGADPDRRESVLQEHGTKRGMIEVLLRHAMTYEGACEILERASVNGSINDLEAPDIRALQAAAFGSLGFDLDEIIRRSREDQTSDPLSTDLSPSTS